MSDSVYVHKMKCWPELFQAIMEDRKTHDLRRADRAFRVGDRLLLCEYDPSIDRYSGRELLVDITYITSMENPCALSHIGLMDDFCILSIKRAADSA
jgi:hypothetical protein